MGEERCKERVLYTWPCGCRQWLIRTVVGDAIEWEEVRRSEPCRELKALIERSEKAERRAVDVYLEYGGQSPEYRRAVGAHGDADAKVEEHTWEVSPTVEIL